MQNGLLAIDDQGMSGIVSPLVADDGVRLRREEVYDLSFAFIAPL